VDKFIAADWLRVAGILVLGSIAWLGVRYVTGALRRVLVRGEVDSETERRRITLVRAVRYALGFVVVMIVVMLLLSEFGISIAPLLGAAGVAGVALGLAAQGLAKDFLRGFTLLLDNQLRVGDVVDVAGNSGTVEEVTLRHVRLREYDGTVHFVRTGEINTVTNHSYGRSFAVADAVVSAGADVERALEVLRVAAEDVAASPEFRHRITGASEVAGIERWEIDRLILRVRVPCDVHAQAAVRRELMARIKAGLDRESIPYPGHVPAPPPPAPPPSPQR